jgi:hypothetical protein
MTRESAAQLYSERRKEVRHAVQLKGVLQSGETKFPLEVGDLSASGALILVKGAPSVGTLAQLWIEEYGPIAIRVMHAGAYFCGVSFLDPAAHRLRLQHWLGEDTEPRSCADRAATPVAADAA